MGYGKFYETPVGRVRAKLLYSSGVNYGSSSLEFKYLSFVEILSTNNSVYKELIDITTKKMNIIASMEALTRDNFNKEYKGIAKLADKYLANLGFFSSKSKRAVDNKEQQELIKTVYSATKEKMETDGDILKVSDLLEMVKNKHKQQTGKK